MIQGKLNSISIVCIMQNVEIVCLKMNAKGVANLSFFDFVLMAIFF